MAEEKKSDETVEEEKETDKEEDTEKETSTEPEKPEEEKEDWETKYNVLKAEHQELLDKIAKEENIKLKDDTFKKYGLREENSKLYHRLLENSNDIDKDVKDLMRDYPNHFGDKDTSIKDSLPTKDYKEEKKINRSTGMIG